MANSITKNMAGYYYNIKLTYVKNDDNKEEDKVDIKIESIKNLVIHYDYENCVMPTILVSMKLDRKLIDNMVLNMNNGYFILEISGYDQKATFSTAKTAINVRCTYYINDKLNKMDMVDYAENNKPFTEGEVYDEATIGLIPVNHINNNKKQCALTVRENKPMDVVKQLTEHIENITIEDFSFNDEMDTLIIPPNMSDSLNKTLQYLNNQKVFYETPYRFFQDFNNTFLISSSGKAIEPKNKGGMDTSSNNIIITISEIDDETTSVAGLANSVFGSLLSSMGSIGEVLGGVIESIGGSLGSSIGNTISNSINNSINKKLDSMLSGINNGINRFISDTTVNTGKNITSDTNNNAVTEVPINYGNVTVIDNTITNKRRNTLKGMKATGSTDKKLESKSELVKSGYNSRRLNNDNSNLLDNLKYDEDANQFMVFFHKTDLGFDTFNINKSISIKNINRYTSLNGKYLLNDLKQSFLRQESNFVLTTYVLLRRIAVDSESNNTSGSGCFYTV